MRVRVPCRAVRVLCRAMPCRARAVPCRAVLWRIAPPVTNAGLESPARHAVELGALLAESVLAGATGAETAKGVGVHLLRQIST